MGREYVFNAPAYLVFGEDSRFRVGDLLQKWGASGNVLLVHGKQVKAAGLIDEIEETLTDFDFTVKTFDKVEPDAPVEIIREGVEFARQENISAVVAVGGGSGMDIAKAIAVMLSNKGDILKYAGVDVVPHKRSCVFVAIPTTCGTGSEMTDGGVVLNTANGRKVPFWDVFAGPDIAILDPFMLKKLPRHLVVQTALDALSHSMEAYTSIMANPISDAMALGAVEIIAKYTPIAFAEENNQEALEMLLSASSMAGIAFNRSNVHMGHAIAHSIGSVCHVHHGAACALALPFVLKTQAEVLPEKIRRLGVCMGINLPETQADVGQTVAEFVKQFCCSLNVKSLGQFGVKEPDLDQIVSYACSDIMMSLAPRRGQPEELKKYLADRL